MNVEVRDGAKVSKPTSSPFAPPKADPFGVFDRLSYVNWYLQLKVRIFYDAVPVQYFFTFLILVNFVIIAMSATSWGMDDQERYDSLQYFDRIFVFIFLGELIINMYGNWWWHFWQVSRWNWFDFIVITLSLVSPVMSAVRVARVVRLLRVLRVAGKLEQLRTIIATFDRSMNAVGAVVCLLLMLMSIYAIFGVHDYRDNDPENFGDLGKAMFTMFQLVTGENWPELARPLMYGSEKLNIHKQTSAPFFFVSFMVIAALTTIEVVAAIFLDKMAEAKDYVQEEHALFTREERLKADIVVERIEALGRYLNGTWWMFFSTAQGTLSGADLQQTLARLQAREQDIDDGHLDKHEVKERVQKERTMHLSMDMASALKDSIMSDLPDGPERQNSSSVAMEMDDAGELTAALSKLSNLMDDMGNRMGRIENKLDAKGGPKRRKSDI